MGDDSALAAARAALEPWAHRLGVNGADFAEAARMAVEAATPLILAGVVAEYEAQLSEHRLMLAEAMDAISSGSDRSQAAIAAMHSRLDVAVAKHDRALADARASKARVAVLVSYLQRIEALAYVGDEPPSRRVAREALALPGA